MRLRDKLISMSSRHETIAAELFPSARSSMRLGLGEVDVIAPGLLHVRFAGHLRVQHIEPMISAGEQMIAHGFRPLIVMDAHDVHAYEAEVRRRWQRFLVHHKDAIFGSWVLFRSPLFKMAITLINPMVGGTMKPFTKFEAFDEAVSEMTERARRGDPLFRAAR